MPKLLKSLAGSLKGRLTLASLLLIPFFFITSTSLLTQAFEKSQQEAEVERLRAMIYSLLGSAEIEDTAIVMPNAVADPRFNDPLSGHFGFLTNDNGRILWRSSSAQLLPPGVIEFEHAQWTAGDNIFFQKRVEHLDLNLNGLAFDVTWSFDEQHSSKLRFIVLADSAALQAERSTYQHLLWQWIGGLGALLLVLLLGILYWGLLPLKNIAKQLDRLQEGETKELEGRYPSEIAPVVKNFNRVLSHQQQQQTRFRNSLADLAHSLKTPLAVITSQLQQNSLDQDTIATHTQRMQTIIEHQLKRAASYQAALTYQSIALQPLVKQLVHTLEKVYFEKHIEFAENIEDAVSVKCEQADLLEILGNILDNACKYGAGKIVIEANNHNAMCEIKIHDNGRGIAPNIASELLQRGARADTQESGQGIGLSVAHEIIGRYQGSLAIDASEVLGGSCFVIGLPA